MTQLHIAIILDDKYPASGGVSRSVQTQIEEFVRLGHSVTLLAPSNQFEPPAGITAVPLPSRRLPGLPIHTRIVRHDKRLAKQICANYTFDIIHSQTDSGALLLAAHIAALQHIPHIHTFHTNMAGANVSAPLLSALSALGYRYIARRVQRISQRRQRLARPEKGALPSESPLGRHYWRSQAIIANAVTAFTTPSQYMRRYIHAMAPTLTCMSRTIPTGYNRALQTLIQNAPQKRHQGLRFMSIGRLVKEKRLDVLIDAFVQAAIPQSELVIIGEGAESAHLQKLARPHQNIIFTGQIKDYKDIAQQLKSADVFTLVSYRFDNQPIVITESLIAGVPLLYCDDRLDIGLHDTNSLCVDPSVEGIAAGMKRLADPAFRQALAQGTVSVFDELAPEATAKGYIELYYSALTAQR